MFRIISKGRLRFINVKGSVLYVDCQGAVATAIVVAVAFYIVYGLFFFGGGKIYSTTKCIKIEKVKN